jgi:hypothetical protein
MIPTKRLRREIWYTKKKEGKKKDNADLGAGHFVSANDDETHMKRELK